jgi:hypothetical protein
MKTRLLVSFLLLARLPAGAQGDEPGPITIILWMDKPGHHYSFTPAPLKYNKDLAFSFTLDDGLVSAARVALPYFAGGRVSASYIDPWGFDQGGDGRMYQGLYYTDGCGHRRPFRGGIAINGKNIVATAQEGSGYLSWQQIDTLYKVGWDVFDHGYAHATGLQVDAAAEISRNEQIVKERTGIQMTQFIMPGGKDDSLSQEAYEKAAFAAGRLAVHSGHYAMDLGLPEDGAAARHIHAGRWFLSSHQEQGNWLKAFFRSIDHVLRAREKTWINAFTHAVGNDDVWGISLRFPDLRALFDGLAARYGAKGKDNMWMASFQEVQEYQVIRHTLKYSLTLDGRRLYCRFDPRSVPAGLRHNTFSFIWRSSQAIRAVKCQGCRIESYTTAGAGKKIQQQVININW